MEQMKIGRKAKIDLNYDDPNLPAAVHQFKPVLFREGESFCMLLGPDPQEGIFGCGDSVDVAISDWDRHFNEEIDNPTEGNETTRFILDNLNTF
jgi:hypothetical protein